MKRILGIFLSVVMVASGLLIFPANAQMTWQDKIRADLWEAMNESLDDDLIAIRLSLINATDDETIRNLLIEEYGLDPEIYETNRFNTEIAPEITRQVVERIGYENAHKSVLLEDMTEEYERLFKELYIAAGIWTPSHIDELEAYFAMSAWWSRSLVQWAINAEIDRYLMARRGIVSRLISTFNDNFVAEYVNLERIIHYSGSFTSTFVLYATVFEIQTFAKNKLVNHISLFVPIPGSNGERQVATPTATPNGGVFTNSVNVTLATTTEDAMIIYTLDGTTPRFPIPSNNFGNPSIRIYSTPITLTATTTINAIAVKDGMVNSEVLTVIFTRQTGGGIPPGNNRPRPPLIVTPPPNITEPPAPPESVPSRAEPTAAPVMLNGENVVFQAYHISGHNFFRLRDVAYALNGTSAQFNVVWDGENNTILLTTGEGYEVAGGEMVNNSSGAVTAEPTAATIFVNGTAVNITAFHINGNNFFMLRDLGEALEFDVEWDEETSAILIETE